MSQYQYIVQYTQGNTPGPFNIYLSGSLGPKSLYASNVTLVELQAGYLVNVPIGINSSSIEVVDESFGCLNEVILPFPTITPTKTITPTITPSITSTPNLTPTNTPTLTPTPSISPTITPTKTATPTITPSITPSNTINPSITPTLTVTPTPTVTPTITPSITVTRTPTPTPPTLCYQYAGGSTAWSTSAEACANNTCARDYYRDAPTFNNGAVVYDDCALTSPVNGGGNWRAIATSTGTFCGGGWRAIRIDNNGVILDSIAC
jgi:hypothetical protein